MSWTASRCVCRSHISSATQELPIRPQVSAFVRLELNSLKNQHDMNAVVTLATRLLEDQKLRDAKREAEAGELSTSYLCVQTLLASCRRSRQT
jgi:hypothetical protein